MNKSFFECYPLAYKHLGNKNQDFAEQLDKKNPRG